MLLKYLIIDLNGSLFPVLYHLLHLLLLVLGEGNGRPGRGMEEGITMDFPSFWGGGLVIVVIFLLFLLLLVEGAGGLTTGL